MLMHIKDADDQEEIIFGSESLLIQQMIFRLISTNSQKDRSNYLQMTLPAQFHSY